MNKFWDKAVRCHPNAREIWSSLSIEKRNRLRPLLELLIGEKEPPK